MANDSKIVYGPHYMSFGELMTKISDVDYFYSLNKSERMLLDKFILSLYRKKYAVYLEEVRFTKAKTWAELTRSLEVNVSRTFKALKDMQILHSLKVGARVHYRLSDAFIQLLHTEFVMIDRLKVSRKKKDEHVKTGDKTEETYPPGYLTVIPPDNYYLSPRITNSYPPGQVALIEEFSPKSSLPPIHFVEVPPDPQPVDNVDNSESDDDRLDALVKTEFVAVFHDPKKRGFTNLDAADYECVKIAVIGIVEKHGWEKAEYFGRYIQAYKRGNRRIIKIKEIPRLLARYETGETIEKLLAQLAGRHVEPMTTH